MTKRIFQLGALAVVCAFGASAATECSSGTLYSIYADSGFSCTLGGRTFSNFSLTHGGDYVVGTADIRVDIVTHGDVSRFVFVMLNDAGAVDSVNRAGTVDFTIKYASTTPDPQSVSAGFGMKGTGSGGTIDLTRDYCVNPSSADAPFCDGMLIGGGTLVSPPGRDWRKGFPDQQVFRPGAVSGLGVRDRVVVNSGTGWARFDELTSSYLAIPEPAPYALFGTGLALLIAGRRRRKA